MLSIPIKKRIKPILYNPRKTTANKVFLFTNARDEKYITEWATHHLLLGFDAIIIFDHKSVIPLQTVFNNKRIIVKRTLLNGGIKIPLMKQAVSISKKQKVDWFMYLDSDEYLSLNFFPNVKSMLKLYPHADSLGINWLMFGSCHYDKDPGPLMENYTKSCATVDKHVKTFVRPETVIDIENAHYYLIYDSRRMFGLPNVRINPPYPFNDTKIPYKNVGAYVAHYVYQSKESYMRRKFNLPRDDTGGSRGNLNLSLLKLYNDVDNFDVKNKYSEKVNEKINEIIRLPLDNKIN